MRGAGVAAAAQECDRHKGHARAGRVEGPVVLPDQCDRRVHHHASPQAGTAGRIPAHPHGPRGGLHATGLTMRPSIRWRLTAWHTLALAAVLVGFAVTVYGMLSHALYQ